VPPRVSVVVVVHECSDSLKYTRGPQYLDTILSPGLVHSLANSLVLSNTELPAVVR
jgi:hypothetical protein